MTDEEQIRFRSKEKFTIEELADFLNMTKGKSAVLFYTAVLNYTDFVSQDSAIPLDFQPVQNCKDNWIKLAQALSEEINVENNSYAER